MSTSIPDISAAINRLRAGGVVAFPTETVYGLGASAIDEGAVRRVYDLKGRPSINPLIVHVSGPEMGAKLVEEWTADADALARIFWPGPLTMVLGRASGGSNKLRVPNLVTAGGGTIGVRCPDHPVALSLLFGLGLPLVGPSANLSGHISPTTAAHVREAFDPEDVLVLEGGPCRAGIESTVLLLDGGQPRVLRPGLIGAGEIAAVIGRPVSEHGSGVRPLGEGALLSPGLLARHYAPRASARLATSRQIQEAIGASLSGDLKIVVIAHERLDVPPPHALIVLASEAEDYAFGLYAALREADGHGPRLILIQRPPSTEGVWSAILDRLNRATSPE